MSESDWGPRSGEPPESWKDFLDRLLCRVRTVRYLLVFVAVMACVALGVPISQSGWPYW